MDGAGVGDRVGLPDGNGVGAELTGATDGDSVGGGVEATRIG